MDAGLGERTSSGVGRRWPPVEAGLGRDVMQQPPDMVVVESYYGKAQLRARRSLRRASSATPSPTSIASNVPTCVISADRLTGLQVRALGKQ